MGGNTVKEWKKDLCNSVAKLAESQKIIDFRKEVAAPAGYHHISTQDVNDIVNQLKTMLPEYKAVHYTDNAADSLFCSLHFIDKTLQFD